MSMIFNDGSNQLDEYQKYLAVNYEISNQVSDLVRTTLGPSSMNKFLCLKNELSIISNDGATILNSTGINHPIAKIVVDSAKGQDYEVGDGTTSVCLLSVELINVAKNLIKEGIHFRKICSIFKKGAMLSNQILEEMSEKKSFKSLNSLKKFLITCCATSLNSKLISSKRHIFSEIIASIGVSMGSKFDPSMISIKTILGGSLNDSCLFNGILIKKPFCYAGSEKQEKKIRYPSILLLDIELEIKDEKVGSETMINQVSKYRELIDAEWSLIYEKLDLIAQTGIKAVFSKKAIGDLATQYFSERGILCGGRIDGDDILRLSNGIGAKIVSNILDINPKSIGNCKLLEERQIGSGRYLLLSGLRAEMKTIVIRGSNIKVLDETKRCLNDGIMIIKKVLKDQRIVGGAGAVEIKLANRLIEYSKNFLHDDQVLLRKFANSLEIIPKTLLENAGFDSTLILSKLMTRHREKDCWDGIDIEKGEIFDAFTNYIWEPASVKQNAIHAAVETACIILSIDNVLFN